MKKELKKSKKSSKANKKEAWSLFDENVLLSLCILLSASLILLVIAIGTGHVISNDIKNPKKAATMIAGENQDPKLEFPKPNPVSPGSPEVAIQNNISYVRLPILMYHHISNTLDPTDKWAAGLTVSPTAFEDQVKFLTDNGFNVVSLDDLYASIENNGTLPSRPIIMTFDDGYRDNYDNAFRILKKYQKKGTFFVITGALGGLNYLSKDEVKEMSDAGMDIESHTMTHPSLATLGYARLADELAGSKSAIEAITGKPVKYLCYPSGAYSPLAINVAREKGYLMALTTKPGKFHDAGHLFELQRERINPSVGLRLFGQLVY